MGQLSFSYYFLSSARSSVCLYVCHSVLPFLTFSLEPLGYFHQTCTEHPNDLVYWNLLKFVRNVFSKKSLTKKFVLVWRHPQLVIWSNYGIRRYDGTTISSTIFKLRYITTTINSMKKNSSQTQCARKIETCWSILRLCLFNIVQI